MANIKDDIVLTYSRKEYSLFFKKLSAYLNKGYGIDLPLICIYIKALINIKKFDKAYELCLWLEENTNYPEINAKLFYYYVTMFKSKDALRVYNRGNIDIENKSYIVKMYLISGNYKKAKKIADEFLKENSDPKIQALKTQIIYHEKYNAFIETSYESFIENGNKLEPGHIVFLKNKPASKNDIGSDEKSVNRPYMIWKFEGNKIYLFPVSSIKESRHYYKLFQQKYPNSNFDRFVKNNLCWSTFSNILSVQDKILDDDFNAIIKDLYRSLYFTKDKDLQKNNSTYIRHYNKDIKANDILVMYEDGERKYYYVIDVNDNYYRTIELEFPFKVIGKIPQLISKSILTYEVIYIQKPIIDKLRSEMAYGILNNSLVGAKLEFVEDNYIVLEDHESFCICVNANYKDENYRVVSIKKEYITSVIDYLDDNELNEIIEYVTSNSKHTFSKVIRKEA